LIENKKDLFQKLNHKDGLKENELTVMHRVHSKHPAKIFEKRFVDQPRAVAYAKDHIHYFKLAKKDKPTDPDKSADLDFDIIDEEDPVVVSQVMECLVLLAKIAKKLKAVIIIPDYMTMSGNSKLIETALDYVQFDGPVINVCSEGQASLDKESAGETYRVKGVANPIPKGLIHNRATHSIQVRNGSYSRVAARLAHLIAQPNQDLFETEDDTPQPSNEHERPHRAVFVVAGGGIAVMEHIAQAVEASIPIVLLQGSKRLCDFLPKLWVRRFSSHFDVLGETRTLCADCGFPPPTDPDNKMNLWMGMLVEKGHVNIHPLPSGTHSLARILQSLQTKDDALLQAMKRYCDYRCAARNMEGPDFRMLIAKLVLGFSTTLLVTIAGAVLKDDELQNILHGHVKFSDVPLPILLLCFSVVVLPGLLSIIMALQHDYNYAPKILALRYAAALVEQEMFRYRACSTHYSDEKITEAMARAKLDAKADDAAARDGGDQGNAQDSTQDASIEAQTDGALTSEEKNDDLADKHVDYDIQSTRARRLTEELIKIGEKVPIFNRPDVKEEEELDQFVSLFQMDKKKSSSKKEKKKDPKQKKLLTRKLDVHVVLKQMKRLSGVKEVAHHTLEDFESEIKFGQLSGEDYATVRLNVYRERYEAKADDLDWVLLIYKVATYAIGAVSGFLSYMGLEVRSSAIPRPRSMQCIKIHVNEICSSR
jgi:hypothetical protein